MYQDLNSVVSVTIDGNPIADGGRVSNLVFSGDSVTFDLLLPTDIGFATVDGYTQLLAANGSVSDVLLYEVVNGQPSYQVTFGSAPDLPVIPPSAVDLTTIGVQGLPADPYYENGAVQQVGTSFETDPVSGNDTFFIQSNAASASPEPGTIALIASGFAVIAIRRRKTVL